MIMKMMIGRLFINRRRIAPLRGSRCLLSAVLLVGCMAVVGCHGKKICTPGVDQCVSGDLNARALCSNDGQSLTALTPCNGNQSCVNLAAGGASCRARVCVPAQRGCSLDHGAVAVCSDDGTAYVATEACPATQACLAGSCIDATLELGGVYRIDGSASASVGGSTAGPNPMTLGPGYYAMAVVDIDDADDSATDYPVTITGNFHDPAVALARTTASALSAPPLHCGTPLHLATHHTGSRAASRGLASRLAATSYTIGSERSFYFQESTGGWLIRTGQLRAVGTTTNLWEDVTTRAPGSTLSEAMLADLSTRLDSGVVPRDTAIFGAPSDVDGNGKIDVFFTELLPSDDGSAAFILPQTLFPLEAGETRDYGEVIYSMVGDDAGQTAALLAHELQHLIMYGQRIVPYLDDPANQPGIDADIYIAEGMAELATSWSGQPADRLAMIGLLYPQEFSLARLYGDAYVSDSIGNIATYGYGAIVAEYLFDQGGAVAIDGPGSVHDLGGIAVASAITNAPQGRGRLGTSDGRALADWYPQLAVALLKSALPRTLSSTTLASPDYRFVDAIADPYFLGCDGLLLTETYDADSAALLDVVPWSQRPSAMRLGGMSFVTVAVGEAGATLTVTRDTTTMAIVRYQQP